MVADIHSLRNNRSLKEHCFNVQFFSVKNSRFVFGQMDRSWLMHPGEEINSTVDQGPCLSLGFIRC